MILGLGRILAAVDFSEASAKAVQYAAAFGRKFGASVTLLHIVEPLACQADYGYGPVNRQFPDVAMAQKAGRRLAALARKLGASGCEVVPLVRSGAAHHEIIRAARELDMDLIVMGTRGQAHLEREPGSTAECVVRNAPCPVFVVRKKEHDFVRSGKSRK